MKPSGALKASAVVQETKQGGYPTAESPLAVEILPSVDDAAHTASREKTNDQLSRDNLDTQNRIATAAEKQANAAVVAAAIVTIETIIASFALWFLMKTFRETKLTAIAAISSVDLARDEFNAAHRPKIIIRALMLHPAPSATSNIKFILYNNGDACASVIEYRFQAVFKGPSYQQLSAIEMEPKQTPFNVDVGEEINWGGHISIDFANFLNATNAAFHGELSQTSLELFGKITYRDLRGNKRHSSFHRSYDFKTRAFGTVNSDSEYAD